MIYVSYFGNRDVWSIDDSRKVCIALRNPTTSIPSCELGLIPSDTLVYGYKYGNVSEETYVETYFESNLNKIDPQDVFNAYDGKILLCFCSGFCHRNIVEYWLKAAGFECKEFERDDLINFVGEE